MGLLGRSRFRAFWYLVVSALVPWLSLDPATATTSNSAQYVYDADGRLLGVVDPVQGSVGYSYDASGNILSISATTPIGTLGIVGFSQYTASPGATVTVYGTGFGTRSSGLSAKFNGTAATVQNQGFSNTAFQVTVPAGASSGLVSVTVGGNTVQSTIAFNIPAATGVPTVTSVSPSIAVLGQTITISGTNLVTPTTGWAGSQVFINGISAAVTGGNSSSLTAIVPQAVSSGHVSVQTSAGTGVYSGYLVVPPAGWAASNIGSVTDITLTNSSYSGSYSTAGANKFSVFLLDVTFDQNIVTSVIGPSFFPQNNNIQCLPQGDVFACAFFQNWIGPNGIAVPITSTAFSESGLTYNLNRYSNLQPGTYSIFVGDTLGPVAAQFTINDVSDINSSITVNGPAVVEQSSTIGQQFNLTFSGTSGVVVDLVTQVNSYYLPLCYAVNIFSPNDILIYTNTVTQQACMPGAENNITFDQSGALTLPATGTYTINFAPLGYTAGTGQATFNLYTVPATALPSSLTANSSAVTTQITTPGQSVAYSFSGTAGQRVSLVGTLEPSANSLSNYVPFNNSVADISISNLYSGNTPQFANGFDQSTDLGTYNFFIYPMSLPYTGNYTITVDSGKNWLTGSVTLSLFLVPADVTGTLTAGSGTPIQLTAPGQQAKYTFAGTQGTTVDLVSVPNSGLTADVANLLTAPVNWLNFNVTDPNGNIVFGSAPVGYYNSTGEQSGNLTLSTTGTYTVQIGSLAQIGLCGGVSCLSSNGPPLGAFNGTDTMTLLNVTPAVLGGTITAGGGPVSENITTQGQQVQLIFTNAVAGASVALMVQKNTNLTNTEINGPDLTITDPNGVQVYQGDTIGLASFFTNAIALQKTGTFTIIFNPYIGGPASVATGTATFTLYAIPNSDLGTITAGGPAVNLSVAAGQYAQLGFGPPSNPRVSLLTQLNGSLGSDCVSEWIANSSNNYIFQPTGCTATFSGPISNLYNQPFTIGLIPQGLGSGTATLTLYSVPNDASGMVVIGQSGLPLTTTVPGQGMTASFVGTAARTAKVSVAVSSSFQAQCYTITVTDSGGGTLLSTNSCNASYTSGVLSLSSATGTNTIHVASEGTYADGSPGSAVGTATITVTTN